MTGAFLALLEALTPAWHDRAACRGQRDLFFPPEGPSDRATVIGRERRAKAICARCPVAGHCLAFAEAGDEWRNGGVWAGLSPSDVYGHRNHRPRRVAS